MNTITFTKTRDIPDLYAPKPASQVVPDWYKNLDSMFSTHPRDKTIKKCMPFFDALTAGYILTTVADVSVTQKNGLAYYEWPSEYFEAITFHAQEQAPTHPAANGMPYPKWVNPWAIKTPKGYSIAINNPVHRESPFSILEGVVDTDTLVTPINFPFVLKNSKFEGLIPAGTPMAQIIPFKRESWKMAFGNKQDLDSHSEVNLILQSRFTNSYKTLFRSQKKYL